MTPHHPTSGILHCYPSSPSTTPSPPLKILIIHQSPYHLFTLGFLILGNLGYFMRNNLGYVVIVVLNGKKLYCCYKYYISVKILKCSSHVYILHMPYFFFSVFRSLIAIPTQRFNQSRKQFRNLLATVLSWSIHLEHGLSHLSVFFLIHGSSLRTFAQSFIDLYVVADFANQPSTPELHLELYSVSTYSKYFRRFILVSWSFKLHETKTHII